MKGLIGKRILKTGIAVSLALFISSLLQLESTFAAIVALIGLKETTQKTFRYSVTLIAGSILAIILGLFIVLLFGNNPLSFGLGTILIISILASFKLNEGLILSVIVMYHVLENYPRQIDDFFAFSVQELLLIFIGLIVSILVNILFPQKHNNYIEVSLDNINKKLYEHLMALSDKIDNPTCSNTISTAQLIKSRKNIRNLIEKAELSKENLLLQDNKKEYYNSLINKLIIQKKLILLLEDMTKETNRLCDIHSHSTIISKSLRILSRIQRFPEHTTPSSYKRLSESIKKLHEEFEASPLPATRKEFEDRSALYHLYLSILEYADELFLIKKC